MTIRQRRVAFTLILVALGYIGAGFFYGYLLGFDTQTPFTCPLCPRILSIGNPVHKFVVRTLVLGTLNGMCFATVGWILRGLIAIAAEIMKTRPN